MEREELERALAVAVETGEEAGALTLEGWRAGAQVRKKGAIDLVTEWDLRSEKLVRERLGAAFPEHVIVGEEGEATGEAGEETPVWYVDPIDGTTNFAHGHPFFSVSIALCRGPELLVGVVVAPALGTTWAGAAGLGAARRSRLAPHLAEVPCRVSDTGELDGALCATGFPYDRRTNPDDNLPEYRAFLKSTQGIRRCGSAALDLALVADGTYDVYWEQRLSPWDVAAGALLVQEAGGRLSDYDGRAPDVRQGRLVATNGRLHEATLEKLNAVRASLG